MVGPIIGGVCVGGVLGLCWRLDISKPDIVLIKTMSLNIFLGRKKPLQFVLW